MGKEDSRVIGRKEEMSDRLELTRRYIRKREERTGKLKTTVKRSRRRSRRIRRDSRLRTLKMEQDALERGGERN